MKSKENSLGYKPIGQLLMTYVLPSIASLVFNSLYNIVYQIFIGRGVGFLGNGATNVVMPITVVAVALAVTIVMVISNNLLVKYGGISKYGEDIPITAFGITMKVSMVISSIAIGISAGSQPIIGFNYGAGNQERVKRHLCSQ